MGNEIEKNDESDIEEILAVLAQGTSGDEGHERIMALTKELGEERFRELAMRLLDSVDAEMQERLSQTEAETEDVETQIGLVPKLAES